MDPETASSRSISGAFLTRRGPAHGAERCDPELCFVATERELLAQVLLELSEHPACVFVKVSVEPRDGMHLGRCVMTDEQVLGELWYRYRCHPRMHCAVQHDAFTPAFRAGAPR